MKIGDCRACGAKMIWTVTVKGNPQPFDVEPVDGGDFILVKRKDESPLALSMTHIEPASRDILNESKVARFMPHHATCPNRGDFAKKKAEKETDPPPDQAA